MMVKILHFADAHIDMARYGRRDPETGMPVRVLDFLKSLDTIIAAALDEKVDLVIFAGDAYKDRNPTPSFQREWGKRIMRLSRAGIPTLLLVGNHDLSPSHGRAHALDAFYTLEVPHVYVIDEPVFLTQDDLEGLPVQIIAIPWLSRSGIMAKMNIQEKNVEEIYGQMEEKISKLVSHWLEQTNPSIPTILAAHASVQGAVYGGERLVMLGREMTLPLSLLRSPKLDYVALGHIHKAQDLNENGHHPVIYPGSIERVDFGEAEDDKFFVIANVDKGKTTYEWRELKDIRPFIDLNITLKDTENITGQLLKVLSDAGEIREAIVRLTIEYPRELEPKIDDSALYKAASEAFEFHLIKHPVETASRARIPGGKSISNLSPLELLDLYWKAVHLDDETRLQHLRKMAEEIIRETTIN